LPRGTPVYGTINRVSDSQVFTPNSGPGGTNIPTLTITPQLIVNGQKPVFQLDPAGPKVMVSFGKPYAPGVQTRPSSIAELQNAIAASLPLNVYPPWVDAAIVLRDVVPPNPFSPVVVEITYTYPNAPQTDPSAPAGAKSFLVKTKPLAAKAKGAPGTGKTTPAGKADSKAQGATVRGTITQASKATVSLTANKQTKVYQVSDKLTQVFHEVNGKDTPASLAQLEQALRANPRGVAGSVTAGPASATGSPAAVIRYTLPSRATPKR
jgi:hypothetical protein